MLLQCYISAKRICHQCGITCANILLILRHKDMITIRLDDDKMIDENDETNEAEGSMIYIYIYFQ